MRAGWRRPGAVVGQWTFRDWAVAGGGLAFLVLSFFDYVGIRLDGFGSYTTGAWHSYAVPGVLLVLASWVLWVTLAVAGLRPPPARWQLLPALVAAGGTTLIAWRAVSYVRPVGIRTGGVLLIVAGGVVTAAGVWSVFAGSAADRGRIAVLVGSALDPPAARLGVESDVDGQAGADAEVVEEGTGVEEGAHAEVVADGAGAAATPDGAVVEGDVQAGADAGVVEDGAGVETGADAEVVGDDEIVQDGANVDAGGSPAAVIGATPVDVPLSRSAGTDFEHG